MDHPAEHHERHIASFGVGDAQPANELAFFSEAVQHAGQCAAAAVNHRDTMTVLRQFRNRSSTFA
jgi:hypothetical protein